MARLLLLIHLSMKAVLFEDSELFMLLHQSLTEALILASINP